MTKDNVYITGYWRGEVALKGGELVPLVWTQEQVDSMVNEIASKPHQCTCGRVYENATGANDCFESHIKRWRKPGKENGQ